MVNTLELKITVKNIIYLKIFAHTLILFKLNIST